VDPAWLPPPLPLFLESGGRALLSLSSPAWWVVAWWWWLVAAAVKPGSGGETQGKGAAEETDGGRRRPAGGGFFLFFEKNVCDGFFQKKYLPSVFWALGKVFAECPTKTLGNLAFAYNQFTECRLPSVTLGKPFDECFCGFAECSWHSAKLLNPVVSPSFYVHVHVHCS